MMKKTPNGRGVCLSAHLCFLYLMIMLCVNTGRTQDTNSPLYVGCFKTTYDANGNRYFMSFKPPSQPGTIDGCIVACGQFNYTYAGGENYVECWCGNALSSTTSNSCSNPPKPCSGNSSQICGVPGAISVYRVCPPGISQWNSQRCLVQCEHCISNKCLVATGACLSQQCETGWNGTKCDQDINECQQPSLNNCDQICTNTPGSYYCTCYDGYSLQNNNQSCADINECQQPSLNKCDQNCTNTPGSYCCTCNAGYSLLTNNQSCAGVPSVVSVSDSQSTNVPGSAEFTGTSTTLQSTVTPGATLTIPLSAFIACVVVLLVCLIAVSAAFAYLYFLYNNVNKTLLASILGSTIMSSSVAQAGDGKTESLTPDYEALKHRDDTSIVRVYEQIKKNGGSHRHSSAVNTLYGNQFHNI